jgi:DNA integrity scanning protein DisA with diadenylate cyclase activity
MLIPMKALINACKSIIKEKKITVLYIITDDRELIDSVKKNIPEIDLIVATNKQPMQDDLMELGIKVKNMKESPLNSINILEQVQNLLLGSCIEGMISINDRVLCLIYTDIESIISFNVANVTLMHLKEEIGNRIDMRILETILNLAYEISREGREGHNVGSLFVIGDSENVLKHSRPLILNPFKGHSEDTRNVLNKENWETIKELAQLDGAFLINKDGIAIATGRYIGVSWDIYLQGGLGGRHLAAASVSKTTKAIAITVSTSGVIRIFKDGRDIFKVSTI